ncbi:MAG TPA: hypothetical protein VGM79_08990 [Streptosporangiaceae bacterium]|jgi:hypothetical protein
MVTRDRSGRPAPERLAASQYGVITRAEAGQCGLTPRMVEHRIRPGGPWQRLLPGVYLTQTGEPGREQLLMAALCHAGEGSMVTGLAALRRHGVSVPETEVVDVLVPHARRRSSREFVVVHRTTRMPATPWADGPITYAPPARAVADAVPTMSRLDDVRAVAAGTVQRGLCTVADLAAELALGPRRDAGRLRGVLAEVADGIRSPAEADLRSLIRRGGLPAPLFNARLHRGQQLLAVPDAWWPARSARRADPPVAARAGPLQRAGPATVRSAGPLECRPAPSRAAAGRAMPRAGPTFTARSLRGTSLSGEQAQQGESCELGS